MNLPDFSEFYDGDLSFSPKWMGIALNPDITVISIANAAHTQIEYMVTIPTMYFTDPSLIFSGLFSRIYDVIMKILGLIGLCSMISSAGTWTVVTSPTGIGSVLGAAALMTLIGLAIKKLFDLTMEFSGASQATKKKIKEAWDSLEKEMNKIIEIQKKLKDGTMDAKTGADEIEKINNKAKKLVEDLKKELEGNENAKKAVDAVEKLMEKFDKALKEAKPA